MVEQHHDRAFDAHRVRRAFPALARADARAERFHYLDSAATTLKPEAVITAVAETHRRGLGNVHRGLHRLAAEASDAFEAARARVARFVGAASAGEVVFVRGTTEALNLVARSFAAPRLRANDEILVTELEHHANLLPWQALCHETGARLVVAPIDDDATLSARSLLARLSGRTALVAVAHVSNALGCVLPIAEICAAARSAGVPVVVDGAQAAAHLPIDVQALDCDFYAISGHKLYGPDGIGALYARAEHLASMPPYQLGGEMVARVSFEHATYAPPPARFEAGTPNVSGALGLAAALDFLDGLDRSIVRAHEQRLIAGLAGRLRGLPGVHIFGAASDHPNLLSFSLAGVHPHDVATVADAHGVAIRTGHHCAQPLMARLGVPGTARASVALYNDDHDLDALAEAIDDARGRLS